VVRFLSAITDPLLIQTTETVEAYGNSGSSVAVTTASGNIWTITLNSATVTITLAGSGNAGVAEALTLYLTQDSTGSRSASWPGSVTWLSGGQPALNPTPGSLTVIILETLDGGSTWNGSAGDLALPLVVANGGTGQVSNGVAGQFLASNGTAMAWTGLLTQPAVVTSAASPYSPNVNELTSVDATAGSVTVDLPGAPLLFGGCLNGVKMITTASSHTATIATTAPDVINRGTGFASGAYVTSLPLSLPMQGMLLSYCPPGNAYNATFSNGSANIVLTTKFSVSPFATGQVVYLAISVPGNFTASVSYYVISATSSNPSGSPTVYTWTYTLAATSTGGAGAILASGSGTTHIIGSGIWTVVADDLPLSQLDLRYLNQNTTGTAAGLSATLAIASGGTASTTAAAALTALTGTQAAGKYVRSDGTNSALAVIQAADVPTLNQSTSGNAANVTGTVAVANGGTNATTAAAALTSLGAAPIAGATFTGAVAPAVITLTDAAPTAINTASGNDYRLLLTSAVGGTRVLSNPTGTQFDGQKILIHVTQPASGGPCLLTYGTNYEFSTGLASPTLSTGASVTDLLAWVYNATKGKWLFAAYVNGFA
jgi:hypothetical protein